MTKEELIKIMEVSGLSKNAIEKRFKMGQGTIGKFLTGKLSQIPEKYVAGIRDLMPPENKGIIPPIKEIDMPTVSLNEYIDNIQPVPPVNFNEAGISPINNPFKEDEANFQKFRDNLDRNIEISKRNKVYPRPAKSLFHLLPK